MGCSIIYGDYLLSLKKVKMRIVQIGLIEVIGNYRIIDNRYGGLVKNSLDIVNFI